MLKYLIEVVENLFTTGVFAALVLSVPYVLKNDRSKQINFKALIIALSLSVLMAFFKERAVIRKYQYVNLVLTACTIISGLIFCVLTFLHFFSKIKCEKTKFVLDYVHLSSGIALFSSLFIYNLPDVLRMPLRFIWNNQSILSTEFLAKLTGWLLALLIIFMSSIAIIKIAGRSSKLFISMLVSVSFLSQIIVFIEFFLSIFIRYRIIKIPVKTARAVIKLVNYEIHFFFVLLAVIAFAALIFFVFNIKISGEYRNPAEKRRFRATARNNRRWAIFLILACIFSAVDLTVLKKLSVNVVVLSPSEDFELSNNAARIPLEQINDGHLHRFTYTASDGNAVRFIVIKKQGTAFGVGFDACEICGATGYYERAGKVICNKCDVVMNINTIGYKGGCNPIPLPYTIADGKLVITTDDLEVESRRFK